MSNGITTGEVGYPIKKETVKKRWIIAGIAVTAIFILATLGGIFDPLGLRAVGGVQGAQTALSGGGSPIAPGIFTPDMRKMNFSQLSKAGYLDTPEKIRQFMIDYPMTHKDSGLDVYEPDVLLRAGGMGTYYNFADFFGLTLKSQGCWDKWNPQLVGFRPAKDGKPVGPTRVMVAFHDARNGFNYYFVPDPDIGFPIYNMTKETNPIPFEKARLEVESEVGEEGSSYYCT